MVGIRVIFLSACSYDYIPIEPCFRVYKSQHDMFHGNPGQAHIEALFSMTSEKMLSFVLACGIYANVPPPCNDDEEEAVVVAFMAVI